MEEHWNPVWACFDCRKAVKLPEAIDYIVAFLDYVQDTASKQMGKSTKEEE